MSPTPPRASTKVPSVSASARARLSPLRILTTVVLGLGTAGRLLLALFFAALGAAGPSPARWGMRTRPQPGVAAEGTG
ncbi:hypothetical protein Slala03_71780 [Streptomyces lavendulae subsp. lavendulae]|uniref:hypothetical protein n=1 Tax=Streptomyces lavendulae TaxID=1914 RepID=UPI0024A0AEF4|nr:hypothetical protein [Streptomyces lavendulae]GLV87489.1 hypothetical protein Slala03_71780 [Streptomyces lavendulae subsp. lavendulae]